MSPSNQAVLFACQVPLSSQVSSFPKPAFVPLTLEHDVVNLASAPNMITDSCWGRSSDHTSLLHRHQALDASLVTWGDASVGKASTSLLSHIPKDQDFSEVLYLNRLNENLAFATVYWSEAEMLYMRHRSLN
jgi:hypothetical protein